MFSLLGSVEKDEVFLLASLLHRFLFLWEIYGFSEEIYLVLLLLVQWEDGEGIEENGINLLKRDLFLERQPTYAPIWNKLFIILKKALGPFFLWNAVLLTTVTHLPSQLC